MLSEAQIQSHADKIARDGYSIVEDAIEPELLDAVERDLERLEQELEIEPSPNRFEGAKTLRVYNLLIYGKVWERIAVHDNVLPLVERVLDSGCLVSSLSSVKILPGEKPQPIHADDQLIPIPKPHVALVCNTMWAFTDFTEDNGATRIMPGTHLADHSPLYGERYESIPAVMRKGSVLVYHGSLWHGGGPNQTDKARIGIAMNYCAGYLRQQENQQLGIPREIAAEFSPRLQELIGYSLYNGLIGHIDKSHPMEMLGRKPVHRMVWEV